MKVPCTVPPYTTTGIHLNTNDTLPTMKKLSIALPIACLAFLISLSSCSEGKHEQQAKKVTSPTPATSDIVKPALPQAKAEGVDVLHFETRPNDGDVYILSGYDVYAAKSAANGPSATLFHGGRISPEWVVEKMIWVLRMNKAKESYIEERVQSLHKSSFTQESTFSKSMFEADGTEHKFVLANSGADDLYTLTYTRPKQ